MEGHFFGMAEVNTRDSCSAIQSFDSLYTPNNSDVDDSHKAKESAHEDEMVRVPCASRTVSLRA